MFSPSCGVSYCLDTVLRRADNFNCNEVQLSVLSFTDQALVVCLETHLHTQGHLGLLLGYFLGTL